MTEFHHIRSYGRVLRDRVALLLALLVLFLSTPFAAALDPDCKLTEVNCKSCRAKSSSLVNYFRDVPRYTRSFTEVESNWGDYYPLLQCDPSDNSTCSLEITDSSGVDRLTNMGDLIDDGQNDAWSNDPKKWGNYLEGTLMYSVLAVAMAILCVLLCSLYLCIRLWSRCCCKDKRDLKVTRCRRRCARWGMCFYVLATLGLCFMGYWFGIRDFKSGGDSMAGSPAPLASMVRDLRTPMVDLLVGVASQAVAPAMVSLNATFTNDVLIHQLVDSIRCTRDQVNGLPPEPDLNAPHSQLLDALSQLPPRDPPFANFTALHTAHTQLSLSLGQQRPALLTVNGSLGALRRASDEGGPAVVAINASVVGAFQREGATASSHLSLLAASLPSAASLTSTRGDVVALVTSGCAGCAADRGVAFRAGLTSALSSLETQVAAVEAVGLTAMASALESYNATAAAALASLDTHLGTLQALQAQVAGLPDLANLTGSLSDTQQTLSALRAAEVRAALLEVDAGLNRTRPRLAASRASAQQLDAAVDAALPCMSLVVQQLRYINGSIARLSADASSSLVEFDAEIANVHDVANATQVLLDQLALFQSTMDALPSLTELAGEMVAMASAQSAYGVSVDTATLVSQLNALSSAVQALQLSSYVTAMATLRASLAGGSLYAVPELTTTLTGAASPLASVRSASASLRGALGVWESGFCTGNASLACACDDPASCFAAANRTGASAACVAAGAGQCNTTFAAAFPAVCSNALDGGPACTVDANCTAGATCTAPITEQEAAAAALASASSALSGYPGEEPLKSALTSALATVSGAPSAADVASQLSALQSAAAGVAGTPAALDATDAVAAVVGALADTSALARDWAVLKGAVDVASVADLLSETGRLNSTRAEVNKATVMDTLNQTTSVSEYLKNGLGPHVERLHPAPLRSLYGSRGSRGVMLEVAVVLEEAYRALLDGDELGLVKDLSSALDALGRMDDNATWAAGPWQYLLSVLDVSDVLNVTLAPADGRAWEDAAGAAYEGDAYCVTDACVANTVELYTKGDTDVAFSSAPAMPVDVETSIALLYVFPALGALLGLLLLCCCRKRPRCASCVSVTTTAYLCCLATGALVLAGALELALLFLATDGCASMENVLDVSMPNLWPAYCTRNLDGALNADGERCTFELVQDVDWTVDGPNVVKDVLGACDLAGRTNSDPPVDAAWTNLRTNVNDYLVNQLTDSLNDMRGKEWEPVGVLRLTLLSAAADANPSLQSFVTGAGDVLSCARLNEAFLSLRDSFCCDAVEPLAFFLLSWVLLAWVTCLCGCTCAAYGRRKWSAKSLSEGGLRYTRARVEPVSGEEPAIIQAAASNNVDRLDSVIRGGTANVNEQSPISGDTALIAATRNGHAVVVRRLLRKYNADPNLFNNDGAGALLYAVIEGHQAVAKALIEAGAEVDPQPAWALVASAGVESMVTPMLAAADRPAVHRQAAGRRRRAARGGVGRRRRPVWVARGRRFASVRGRAQWRPRHGQGAAHSRGQREHAHCSRQHPSARGSGRRLHQGGRAARQERRGSERGERCRPNAVGRGRGQPPDRGGQASASAGRHQRGRRSGHGPWTKVTCAMTGALL